MRNRILVLGGSRSGKSVFAEEIARSFAPAPVLYIATAECCDDEMAHRIAVHRRRRPASWTTLEAPASELPKRLAGDRSVLLFDSLTMWLSSLCCAHHAFDAEQALWEVAESELLMAVSSLLSATQEAQSLVVVSDEIGLSPIPEHRAVRRFRDLLGKANQQIAASSSSVALVVAGLPLWLKGGATP